MREQHSTSLTILDLRKERNESQSEFGQVLGLSAGKVSEIETGQRPVSLRVALIIEELSVRDGVARIDAALLNDDVAAARGVVGANGEPEVQCQGCDAAASAPFDEAQGQSVQNHSGIDSAAAASASTGQSDEMSRLCDGFDGQARDDMEAAA